jgi:hypothetical protein
MLSWSITSLWTERRGFPGRSKMDQHPHDPTDYTEWDSTQGSEGITVEAVNRFLGAMVKDTWDDLDRALKITEDLPDFSGILPLGDPSLRPFLNMPGIFFIFGPLPTLSLLHIGASRGPIGFVLRSRIEEYPDGRFGWRGENRSEPPPTFVAIATMEEYWAFAPPLRNLLARKLGEGPVEDSGGTDPVIPYV